jgi:hypothetical protein
MLQNWFRIGQKHTGSQYLEPLLQVLATGAPEKLKSWIYAYESLTEADCSNILQSLSTLNLQGHTSQDSLQVVSRYNSGRFLLLVLQVPWLLQTGDEYCPLMLKLHQRQWRLVGCSQPWVALLDQFSNPELDDLQTLSAAWIQHRLGGSNI